MAWDAGFFFLKQGKEAMYTFAWDDGSPHHRLWVLTRRGPPMPPLHSE